MAGIKIVDLPPLGRDLASTDLLELSLAGGTGSRKITGQEIMNTSKLNIGTTAITSGTVGRVLFEGTGNVVQESANFFWDNTNGRLGIGTSSPTQALDIFSGNIDLRGTSSPSINIGTGGYPTLKLNNRVAIQEQNSFTVSLGNAYTNLALYTASSEKARIASTGNVLINTTTDAGYKLDVNGTARVNAQLEVNSVNSTQGILLKHFASATTATKIYYNSPDAVTYFDALYSYAASSLAASYNFRTKNSSNALTSRLFIQGWNGSIGIGTTTPVGKTDIVTGFADASSLNQAETFRLRSTAVDFNTRVMNFGISHTGVGGANQGYGYIQFGYSGGSVDNPLVLQPLGGGVSVGAAVATSDYKLQVLKESSIKAAANSGGGALGGRLSFPFAGSYSGKVAYIAQVQDGASWFNSAGLVFATLNGSDISASTGVERMRIGGNGNVLINTTTDAGFKLDVNGTARATQITASTNGGSFNVGSVNVVDFGNGLRIGYSGSVNKISLFTNFGTQGLQVNNGSVSIGPQLTPNASAILDITSTTKGFLPPRMTQTERNAIASPAIGLEIYQTDATEGKYIYKSSGWTYIG